MKNNIKLVCFDLNETLIKEHTWLIFNKAMGLTESEDAMMCRWSSEGIITENEWAEILLAIYNKRGRPTRKEIERIVLDYNYFNGVREIIKYLKDEGYTIALISGAMDILVEHVASELRLDFYKANCRFIFDENNNLIEMREEGNDIAIKVKFLKELCGNLNIKLEECACVGDGANDLGLFKATGRGITFKGSKIKKNAWIIVDNLLELKKIL